MATKYGGEGERSKRIPPFSEPLFPHRNSPAPGESGSLPIFPVVTPPARGLMFCLCSVCKAALPSTPVDHDDDANGGISHGLCPRCHEAAMAEARAALSGEVQFTDHCEDGHAIAHAMGERFISEDCRAFAVACGFEPLPGGVA